MRVERISVRHGDGKGAVCEGCVPAGRVEAAGVAHELILPRDASGYSHGEQGGHVPLASAVYPETVQYGKSETAGGADRAEQVEAAHGNPAQAVGGHNSLKSSVNIQRFPYFVPLEAGGHECFGIFVFGVNVFFYLAEQFLHRNADKPEAEFALDSLCVVSA